MPPQWETELGMIYHPNKAQEILYKHWEDWCDTQGKYCDSIVLVGDNADGLNKKQWGKNTITNPDEQVKMAVSLLAPLCEGKKVCGVNGSGYHQAPSQSLDAQIIQALGGEYYGPIANLEIEGTGKHISVTHSSGGAVIYRETAAARESIFMDAAEALGKIESHIDIALHGHWHMYLAIENESRWAVYSPAWKLIFDWVRLTGLWTKYLSMIGGVVLEISENDIRVHKKLYPPPKLLDKIRIF